MKDKYLIEFERNINNKLVLEYNDYYDIHIVRFALFKLLKDTERPIKSLKVFHNGRQITDEIIKNIRL